jgi:two-component system CheB/CheR fusion protein
MAADDAGDPGETGGTADGTTTENGADELDAEFEALLDHIRDARGLDFTGYKRSTLFRRIRKRMQELKAPDYATYRTRLAAEPAEFERLLDTILINVTSFFRDEPSWRFVSDEIIPRIVSGKQPGEPIRVWSAGCASGEETYSLAILFAEALGRGEFRDRMKIYGTDVDEEALSRARQGSYSFSEVESLPREYLEKYFEMGNGGFVFHKDLRRAVIFGRNDLMCDAPISRLDLLVCRNTLMYFVPETQSQILERFHFALLPSAYLMLGKAETLLSRSTLFSPVDLKLRLFQKSGQRERGVTPPLVGHGARGPEPESIVGDDLRDLGFLVARVPMILIDVAGRLVLANQAARSLFGLTDYDLNAPIQDVELSYRPLELRSLIDEAISQHRVIERSAIEWVRPGRDTMAFDIVVTPLASQDGEQRGVSVVFIDVTKNRRLQAELQAANTDLETAYEELQSTNEELETTNEELQSTVEELETTNEELQSTNEELETINEELQSTNDELHVVNDTLEVREDELGQVNAYLEAILTGIRQAVVVLDRELQVHLWNQWAYDLWGVRSEEARGKNFLNLDIGLPVASLRDALRSCLSGASEQELVHLDARNRRGFDIRCQVTSSPLTTIVDGEVSIDGVILLMVEERRPG